MTRFASLITGASIGALAATTNYLIQTPGGAFYLVYVDRNEDVVFRKSVDGGHVWSAPTTIFTGTCVYLAVWYDKWSGLSGGLIHCAYTDSGNDDTMYRSIDTESSDALSTETTIFAGTTTATNGALSIVRARGGNLYCKTMIDAGAEGGFYRSTDVGATWGSRTDTEALATGDQWILVPGFAADNQDIMCVFWDNSASEISRYVHDDSANSWAETSISTGMTVLSPGLAVPNFSAAVDLTNSQILLCAWNAADTLNQDLLGWKITESAITAFGTTPVLNATDDCALCAMAIDLRTNDWYVVYLGKSDGSDVWSSQQTINYKKSTDSGATWSAEASLHNSSQWPQYTLLTCPRAYGPANVVTQSGFYGWIAIVDTPVRGPRASFVLGV